MARRMPKDGWVVKERRAAGVRSPFNINCIHVGERSQDLLFGLTTVLLSREVCRLSETGYRGRHVRLFPRELFRIGRHRSRFERTCLLAATRLARKCAGGSECRVTECPATLL